MPHCLRILGLVALVASLCGCAQAFYDRTGTATVTGNIDLFYREPNLFVYIPTSQNPLTFLPSKGAPVTPGPMLTDGGSVPRLFWSVPNFGPWDYGHGYVIHDWLFAAHHCGDTSISFEDSARYLAEAMKAEMKSRNAEQPDVLWLVHEAVASNIARNLWDRPNACDKKRVEDLAEAIRTQLSQKSKPLVDDGQPKFRPVGKLACESGVCKLRASEVAGFPDQ